MTFPTKDIYDTLLLKFPPPNSSTKLKFDMNLKLFKFIYMIFVGGGREDYWGGNKIGGRKTVKQYFQAFNEKNEIFGRSTNVRNPDIIRK